MVRIVSIVWIFFLINKTVLSAEQDSSILLLFGGDVTFANHFENYVNDSIGYTFKKMKWFSKADISMVNLENPITREGHPVEKKFTFKARPEYVDVLIDGGVDIVTLANNHIYDYGSTGLINTLEFLNAKNIQYTGAGRDIIEARHPVIFYIKGLNIAYFSYFGTHKHSDSSPATEDSAGTAVRQLPVIKEDISKYRNIVDYIIINFHWGDEKAPYPGSDQIDFAHSVIDYGADVIIGHHPHVLQGIESYKGKIIAYSLGNFIFGGNSRVYYKTAVLKLEIAGHTIIPTVIPLEVKFWQPAAMEGNDAVELLESVKKLSSVFKKSIFDKED